MSCVTASCVADVRAAWEAALDFDNADGVQLTCASKRLGAEMHRMAAELDRRFLDDEFTVGELVTTLSVATVAIGNGLRNHGHTPECGENEFIKAVLELLAR